MKIAIVNRHVDDVLGGSEMQCGNIACGLSEKGHKVIYVAPAGSKDKNYARPYKVLPIVSNATSIAAAVISTNPDIVYWRFNKFFLYQSAKAIAEKKIPIVFSISHINDTKPWSYRENPLKSPKSFLKSLKQGCENLFNHRGYQYISGVASLNKSFLNLIPVTRQRYLPNSVDTRSMAFSWHRPYVVWVANLKPPKQPELYLRLAKELAYSNIDFLMVGDIQSTDYYWIRSANEHVPNFHYLGSKTLQEVNGILEGCLLNIHTCKPEGFGNIFIQAWLKRKPTASLAFDPDELITKENLGSYADGDFNLFKQQVAQLIQDQQLRDFTGENAFNFGSKNFSIAKTVDEIEGFLSEVLAAELIKN